MCEHDRSTHHQKQFLKVQVLRNISLKFKANFDAQELFLSSDLLLRAVNATRLRYTCSFDQRLCRSRSARPFCHEEDTQGNVPGKRLVPTFSHSWVTKPVSKLSIKVALTCEYNSGCLKKQNFLNLFSCSNQQMHSCQEVTLYSSIYVHRLV